MPTAKNVLRVECTTPGLEGNWLEVTEVWTAAEAKNFFKLKGPEFIKLWRQKVLGCHLETGDLVIDDPQQVHDLADNLDVRLVRGFINEAPATVLDHLLSLGEANKRLLLPGAGAAVKTETAPT